MPQITVEGMHCQNCVKAVTNAARAVPGISSVEVDLASGKLTWIDADSNGPADVEALKKAVRDIGFEVA